MNWKWSLKKIFLPVLQVAHVSMLDDSISSEDCKCLETELNSSENRVSVCVIQLIKHYVWNI